MHARSILGGWVGDRFTQMAHSHSYPRNHDEIVALMERFRQFLNRLIIQLRSDIVPDKDSLEGIDDLYTAYVMFRNVIFSLMVPMPRIEDLALESLLNILYGVFVMNDYTLIRNQLEFYRPESYMHHTCVSLLYNLEQLMRYLDGGAGWRKNADWVQLLEQISQMSQDFSDALQALPADE